MNYYYSNKRLKNSRRIFKFLARINFRTRQIQQVEFE